MTTDSSHAALFKVVRREYGLELARLSLVPRGEITRSYIAECADGRRFFLKLYTDSRQSRASAVRLDFTLSLTQALRQKGQFRLVPAPIQTLDGRLRAVFAGQPLILFEYICGRTLGELQPWPEGAWAKLGHAVALIHQSTDLLGLEIPVVERFDTPFERDFLAGLDALGRVTARDTKGQQALRDLLWPRREEALLILERLHGLQTRARQIVSERVLCHTDLTPDNLVLDEQGRLYVLDWEGAMLAPPEHDLFCLTGKHFEAALAAYARERDEVHLHADLFSFYFHLRNLEDLTDWMIRILYERQSDAQDQRDLAGIQEDCLRWWPNLYADGKLRALIEKYGAG